jgi:Surface lipoprotein
VRIASAPIVRALASLLFLSAAASVCPAAVAAPAAVDRDPWVRFNRPVHVFNERVDDFVLEPAALFYRRMTPDPVERAILNFFDNIASPISITGAALQADGERTAIATGRFLVNSTVGLAGLLDPATSMGLPDVDEDIGQALEVWGFEDSPYLVLPFIGPMTLVQVPDRIARAWLPQLAFGDYWHQGWRVLDVVSYRADVLAASTLLDSSAIDSYSFTREAFLQRRRYLRYNGELPEEDWDAFLDDF